MTSDSLRDPGSLLKHFTSVLGSQIGLAVIGLLTLPFIARGLGVEEYGSFSLFLVIIAAVNNFEFGRVLFTKEYVSADNQKLSDLSWVSVANIFISSIIGLVAGLCFLETQHALALAGIGLFQALGAPDYAWMAKEGELSRAVVIRNLAWASAFVILAIGSFYVGSQFSYSLPFLVANIVVFGVYIGVSGRPRPNRGEISWGRVKLYLARATDISVFNVAGMINVSTDKMVLQKVVSPEPFGQYVAHADLATKMNMLSNAIGNALYPMLASSCKERGIRASFEHFKRICWAVYICYFVVILVLILLSKEILTLLLGSQFAGSVNLYPLFLLGVFLQLAGFLFVPWSRAVGEFSISRKVYSIVAVIVLSLGLTLIPVYGLYGAIVAYFAARLADLFMAARCVASLPSGTVRQIEVWLAITGGVILAITAILVAGVL